MTGLTKFLGRGLLVLALGSYLVACGDDDDDGSPVDAGAGSGGSGGSAGKAGSSGKGGSGGMAGTMPSGGGMVTKAECIEAAKDATGNMVSTECSDCLCTKNAKATAACTTDCWKLANCVAANGCGASDITCITNACTDDLGGSTQLAAAGTLARATPFTMCTAQCFVTTNPDAETDAGN